MRTILLLLLPWTASAVIVPDNRLATNMWASGAGVKGGITNYTTIFVTLPISATLGDINNAIANCPNGQVVQLSAGTYFLSDSVTWFNNSGVVLRGAGMDETVLRFSGGFPAHVEMYGGYNPVIDSQDLPVLGRVANVTAGFTKGTSTFTLDNVSDMFVGDIIAIDQLNDNIDVALGGHEGCSTCSRSAGARAQQQYSRVTAIDGLSVTTEHELLMNYSNSLDPEMYWIGSPIEYAGLEDLTVDATDSQGDGTFHAMWVSGFYSCWVKNVKFRKTPGSAVATAHGCRLEVRHCTMFETESGSSESYGVNALYSSFGLIEDNIMEDIVGGVLWENSAGYVVAYNYLTNTVNATAFIPALLTHGAHSHFNLIEGNHANGVGFDVVHGSGSHNTVLRNRLPGIEGGLGVDLQMFPIIIHASNHFINVVGNVLGDENWHARYATAFGTNAPNANPPYDLIYEIGYLSESLRYDYPDNYDPSVWDTLIRGGNYDVVSDAVVWEPPTTPETIPNSWYLASKPDYFGFLGWPPYDPANLYDASSISRTNIPAGYRYVYGVDPPASSEAARVPFPGNRLRGIRLK